MEKLSSLYQIKSWYSLWEKICTFYMLNGWLGAQQDPLELELDEGSHRTLIILVCWCMLSYVQRHLSTYSQTRNVQIQIYFNKREFWILNIPVCRQEVCMHIPFQAEFINGTHRVRIQLNRKYFGHLLHFFPVFPWSQITMTRYFSSPSVLQSLTSHHRVLKRLRKSRRDLMMIQTQTEILQIPSPFLHLSPSHRLQARYY